MRNGSTQENNALLSLYIDGKYCECNVHSLPFLKGSLIMLPLHVVASELGYRVEHHHEEGYDLVYRHTVFDKQVLTVRYTESEDGSVGVSYYYQNGQFIHLPPVEILADEIFVPMELVTAAMNCTCQASASGNINIRYNPPAHNNNSDNELHVKMLSDASNPG